MGLRREADTATHHVKDVKTNRLKDVKGVKGVLLASLSQSVKKYNF
jgi:hypothetical protein